MNRSLFRVRDARFLCGAVLACATACSGGGGESSPQAGRPADLLTGALHLSVPARTSAAGSRRRTFVSPSVASVAIAVSGIATTVIADVGGTSPDCIVSGTTRTCSIPVAAPVGTDTFTATLYDKAGATGNVLGSGTSTSPVSHSGFAVSLPVSGSAASLTLAAEATGFSSGVSTTTIVSVSAFDADTNEITGTYASPVSLTLSNATAFTLTPSVITSSGQTVTLAYNGAPGVTSVTISASSPDVAAGATVPVTLPVTSAAPTALTLSSTFVQFNGSGVTSNPIAISGSAPVNYAAMTASTSNAAVVTATLASDGKSFTLTSTGVGSATITVVPSDGSALPATLTVHVQTTTVQPSLR